MESGKSSPAVASRVGLQLGIELMTKVDHIGQILVEYWSDIGRKLGEWLTCWILYSRTKGLTLTRSR